MDYSMLAVEIARPEYAGLAGGRSVGVGLVT